MPGKLAQEYHEADLGWKLTAGLEMALDAAASAPPPASAAAPAAGPGHSDGDLRAYLSKCVDLENPARALLRVYAQIEQQPVDPLETEVVPPGDAEDWLAEGEGTLEAALEARQREGGTGSQAREEAFDPSQLAASMRSFIEQGAQPAEGGPSTSGAFEVGGFLEELKRALGGVEQTSSEEGSSFWEGSQSDQEGDQLGSHEETAPWLESGASACTATDSDDEENERNAFAEAYDQHLGQELQGTAARGIAAFDAAKGPAADPGCMPGCEGSAGATRTPQGHDAALEDALEPVRLDEHLVRNLLASYAGQEGMAGPVQSIAGLLGVALPDSRGLRDGD
ncbi:hypothetical protein H632_c2896p0 [Helicosporidium sp. ATCC 50920]|nr:hypothetical protein H632_c2896p0 [Helicosporidium sp. ATCC 50920]|eukprot:KDD72788.1 hypothetical protein H632_c2896p0 [Helicosporidium sp. ATCC 50920]